MAGINVTSLSDLLAKRVLLTELVGGVHIERSGVCTAYTSISPGSRCDPEFLLEQDDGDMVFYSLDEVTLHSIG